MGSLVRGRVGPEVQSGEPAALQTTKQRLERTQQEDAE